MDRDLFDAGDYDACMRYQTPESDLLQWLAENEFERLSVRYEDAWNDGLGEED